MPPKKGAKGKAKKDDIPLDSGDEGLCVVSGIENLDKYSLLIIYKNLLFYSRKEGRQRWRSFMSQQVYLHHLVGGLPSCHLSLCAGL